MALQKIGEKELGGKPEKPDNIFQAIQKKASRAFQALHILNLNLKYFRELEDKEKRNFLKTDEWKSFKSEFAKLTKLMADVQ